MRIKVDHHRTPEADWGSRGREFESPQPDKERPGQSGCPARLTGVRCGFDSIGDSNTVRRQARRGRRPFVVIGGGPFRATRQSNGSRLGGAPGVPIEIFEVQPYPTADLVSPDLS